MRPNAALPCLALAGFLLTACGAGENPAVTAEAAPPASVAPDMDAIAHSVVTRTARIAEGDLVLITGSVRDLELLENLSVEVSKAGGKPMIVLNSERITRRFYDEVPERYFGIENGWDEQTIAAADVVLSVDPSETPDLLAHVPPAHLAAVANAQRKARAIARARGIRFVEVGNAMYPTHARAALHGMSRDDLARFFWSAVTADFTQMDANVSRLREILSTADELHITDSNGTDLRLRVVHDVRVSDGRMSDEMMAQPGEKWAWLPAGEVFTRVVAGSAEGVIVADRMPWQGKHVEQLRMTVSKGRLVGMTAASGLEPLQARYDAAGEGRDILSLIDFGTNPGITAATAQTLRTWVAEGTVTPYFGGDDWAGGTNDVPFGLSPHLANATVRAGDRVIIENGKLTLN